MGYLHFFLRTCLCFPNVLNWTLVSNTVLIGNTHGARRHPPSAPQHLKIQVSGYRTGGVSARDKLWCPNRVCPPHQILLSNSPVSLLNPETPTNTLTPSVPNTGISVPQHRTFLPDSSQPHATSKPTCLHIRGWLLNPRASSPDLYSSLFAQCANHLLPWT